MFLPSAIVLRHFLRGKLITVTHHKCTSSDIPKSINRIARACLPSGAKAYEFPFLELARPSVVDECLETDKKGRDGNIYEGESAAMSPSG